MSQVILITGNMVNGFEFVGPFDSTYEAADYAESSGRTADDPWFADLIAVADLKAPVANRNVHTDDLRGDADR